MQSSTPFFTAALAVSLLALTGCNAPLASDPIPTYDGARLYRENCATCHGKTGAGDGPMVPHLKSSPSNLRLLSSANGGSFPRLAVWKQIDGRDFTAGHGSGDMPVWGWVFTQANNDKRDPTKQSEARIGALVDHLETLQD